MSKILFVLTNYKYLLNGEPTGLWLEEFAVPYLALTDAGHEVEVTSVTGGDVPIDPNSTPTEQQANEWKPAMAKLNATPAFSSINAREYDAIYLPGGHGTVFDMPYNLALHETLFDFHRTDRLIASVCHAPAVFAGMYDEHGTPFIKGRKIAAFTDSEEAAAGGTDKVPFLLESRLKALGAEHEAAPDWQPHAVQDGKLITGQNPQSSAEVAHLMLTALK